MCDIHFRILQKVFINFGYDIELLTTTDRAIVDEGLKYVHNDTCYPALLTIGQMIHALKSGKYDLEKTALIMTQTGGGCRASNYIHLLRKALENSGMDHIPVVSVNISGLENNPGFKLSLPLLKQAMAAIIYGDMLTLLYNQTLPYEVKQGESKALVAKWVDVISNRFIHRSGTGKKQIGETLAKIVASFEKIELSGEKKVKVGIVGEIYVKYSPLANNNLEEFLHGENCEVMVPGLLNFLIFKVDNRLEDIKLYGGSAVKKAVVRTLFNYLVGIEDVFLETLKGSKFTAPSTYAHLKKIVRPFIGYGCKMGEGWLLTAEMLELIECGYGNIVCAQPFGCLPNHIVGKGMFRKIKEEYKNANIVAIDYDPGATKVNQENRIKLMLSVGKEQLREENK